jgi:1,4-dihydroxy-2-naphthoate octaprenyltransferase
VARFGWPVLAAGVLAVVAGLAYTGGPWPIAYRAVGEVFVFVFFGLVAVAGTTYVQTGALDRTAVVAGVPVGLLCSAILIVNNLRDLPTDRAAGKRTLAVWIGPRLTRALYVVCLVAAAAVPAVMRIGGLIGWGFWLPWLTLPMMARLMRTVAGAADSRGNLAADGIANTGAGGGAAGAVLNLALKRTARLHLAFGVLLAAGLLW